MNEKDSHSMRMIFRAVRILVYLIRYSYQKPKRKHDKHRSSSLLLKIYNSTNQNKNNNDRHPKTTTILLNDFDDNAGGYGLMRYIVENYSCHYKNMDSTVVRHTRMKLENILLSGRKKAAAEQQQQSNVDSYHCNKQRNLLEPIGEE